MISILPCIGPAPKFDRSFTVTAELRISLCEGIFTYDAVAVEPYEKTYADEGEEDGGEMFAAHLNGELAGIIVLSRAWNGYALIEDIAVARNLRRVGVAAALLRHAKAWCLRQGLPGIMLETQHNNLAACRLYERHGFRLRGVDLDLYRGLPNQIRPEIALFWYWQADSDDTIA